MPAKAASRTTKPPRAKLVHTWYAYPMESFMATPAKEADKYKCWKDFSGKPVFFTAAGFMNWLNFQRVFKALGYDFKHVQIDPKSNSDALERAPSSARSPTQFGQVAGALLEGNRSAHGRQRVNPCPDEIAKLKAAGLADYAGRSERCIRKDVGAQGDPRRADPVRLQRAGRICPKTSSTR